MCVKRIQLFIRTWDTNFSEGAPPYGVICWNRVSRAPGARPMKWGALRVIILIDESPENQLRKASLYFILIKACPAGKEQKEALSLLTTRMNCSFLWSLTTSKPYPAYLRDTLFYFPSSPWQCPMLVMNQLQMKYARSYLARKASQPLLRCVLQDVKNEIQTSRTR